MNIAVAVTVMILSALVSEPVFILVGLMRTSEQEASESYQIKTKGAGRRRQHLRAYATATITMMAILLIAANECWQIWTAPVDYSLADIPEDPSDGWAAAAVILVILACAGLPWLMILRAKLKAIRRLEKPTS